MLDIISSIKSINEKISELERERSKMISSNSEEILNLICRMMDWCKNDIVRSSIEYSSFERRIMVQIRHKHDAYARYVFEVNGKGEIKLRFREIMV